MGQRGVGKLDTVEGSVVVVIEVSEPDVEAAGEEDAKDLEETQATPYRPHYQ